MQTESRVNSLTLIIGGARSGKSAHAEEVARASGRPVLYVATATALDDEMRERIAMHRLARPPEWQTLETSLKVGAALVAHAQSLSGHVVLLDCITLLVSNVLLALLEARDRLAGQWLIVSNEVGLGLVPPYLLGRLFRDTLGRANQRLARAADKVVFMVAGVPMVVK